MPANHISMPSNTVDACKPRAKGTSSADARRTLRYEIFAQANYKWLNKIGTFKESRGVTRDMSTRGAFIIASECPPIATNIELTINVSDPGRDCYAFCLHANGVVQRVETAGGMNRPSGFSVQIQRLAPLATDPHHEPEKPI